MYQSLYFFKYYPIKLFYCINELIYKRLESKNTEIISTSLNRHLSLLYVFAIAIFSTEVTLNAHYFQHWGTTAIIKLNEETDLGWGIVESCWIRQNCKQLLSILACQLFPVLEFPLQLAFAYRTRKTQSSWPLSEMAKSTGIA